MKGYVMSKKDLKTYRHAMNVIEGKLRLAEFALLIGKSYRQAHRIVKKTKEQGRAGMYPWQRWEGPCQQNMP